MLRIYITIAIAVLTLKNVRIYDEYLTLNFKEYVPSHEGKPSSPKAVDGIQTESNPVNRGLELAYKLGNDTVSLSYSFAFRTFGSRAEIQHLKSSEGRYFYIYVEDGTMKL